MPAAFLGLLKCQTSGRIPGRPVSGEIKIDASLYIGYNPDFDS